MKIIRDLFLPVLVCVLALGWFLSVTDTKVELPFGGASDGIAVNVATTSNPTVGTSAVTVFATSTCLTRVVTTYASPVMITFSDRIGQTPTATFGHLQAASTTVVYDASEYGCGLYKMYGFVSTAITVSETR